jgi:hypothetical protein
MNKKKLTIYDYDSPVTYIFPASPLEPKKPMAPSFSKLPIPAIPDIATTSGLRCTHAGCFALFCTLADSADHAIAKHGGKNAAVTCSIYEHTMKSGEIRLHQVLYETGE